jgi:hypothetical protein
MSVGRIFARWCALHVCKVTRFVNDQLHRSGDDGNFYLPIATVSLVLTLHSETVRNFSLVFVEFLLLQLMNY